MKSDLRAPCADRTRTVVWENPAVTAIAAKSMGGLDFLREMAAGRMAPPPIAATLGFVLEEVEPGEEHYNAIGSMHGGVYATLLDSATGCAVHSTLEQGTAYTSLDLSTRFLRFKWEMPTIGLALSSGPSVEVMISQFPSVTAAGATLLTWWP